MGLVVIAAMQFLLMNSPVTGEEKKSGNQAFTFETIIITKKNQDLHDIKIDIHGTFTPFLRIKVSVGKSIWIHKPIVTATYKDGEEDLVFLVMNKQNRKDGSGIVNLDAHPKAIENIEVRFGGDRDERPFKIFVINLRAFIDTEN